MKNVIKLFFIAVLVFSCGLSEDDYLSKVDVARKYLNEKSYELASQKFYELLDDYPKDGLVLYGLAASLLGNAYSPDGKTVSDPEKLHKSILYLKKALELYPRNLTIGLTYAAALVDNKEYEEGINVFENYYGNIDQVEIDAEPVALRYFEALKEMGKFEKANIILVDIKNNYPEGLNVNDSFWGLMIANFENQNK